MYELVDSLLQENIELGLWSPAISPQAERKGISFYRQPSIPLILYREYRVALPYRSLTGELDDFKPDILHVTHSDFMGYQFLRYAGKRNIPIIANYHTDYPAYLKYYHIGFLEKFGWSILMDFYNRCRTTYVPGEFTEKQVNEKGILNTRIWSRGVHAEKFNPAFRSDALREKWGAKDKKVILFAGKFAWFKNLEMVITLYDLFMSNCPDRVVFAMVGSGQIEKTVRKRMPLANFTGYLTGRDLSEAYASADIFLFPSTTETFGNVVLEALASGLPSVVSNIGGCQDIVRDADAGFVANAGDPGSFYDRCMRLIDNGNTYDEKRRNGIAYAASKKWKTVNNVIIDHYREIMSERTAN